MDSVDPIGRTVLHFAAAIGNLQIIKLLIENGVNVNSTDKHGNTALHEAAWKGYSQTIQLLCKSKADSRLQNKSGNTPLHLACQRGHNQSCRTLLIYGRQKHQIHRLKNNFGDTSLHTAARYGHAGALRILISAFCSVNEINENGDTALHISAAMGRRKLTKILLEAGCDTTIKNKQSETALEIATRKGFKEVQEMIAKAPVVKGLPVDPNAKPGASKASSSQDSSKSRRAKHRLKKELKMSRHKSCHDSPYGCPLAPDVKELCKTPTKSPPPDPLKKGEQYYIDLAGNVRKGPVGKSVCFCSPLFEEFEKKLTKDKKELKEKIDCCHDNLDKKIDNLEEKTSHQLVTLNEAIKSKIANERSQCIERSQRSNLKQRIDFEQSQSQQVEQLKSQMKFWLESKLGSAILRRQERNLQFISNPSNLDSSLNISREQMQLGYSSYSHLGMIPEPTTPDITHFMLPEHESPVKSVTHRKYERSQSCLGPKDSLNHVPNFSKSKSETHLAPSQIPLDEYKRDPFFIEPSEEDIVRAEVYHYDDNSGSEESISGDQNDSEHPKNTKQTSSEIPQRYQAEDVTRDSGNTSTSIIPETDNIENPSVSGSVKDLMKSLRCDPLAISEFDYRNSPFSDSGFRSKYSPSPRECPVVESSLYSNHMRDTCIVPSDPPIGLPPPPPTYESYRRLSMPRELHTRAMIFSSDGNIVMAKDIEKINANIEKMYVTQQLHPAE